MPKVNKQTASNVERVGPVESWSEPMGDFIASFSTFHEHADGTPLFRGLPGDRCQAAHWGYILKGSVTFRWADHDEIFEAGDAFYAPPGHIPVVAAGTEAVEFSTATEYAETLAVIERNLAALSG